MSKNYSKQKGKSYERDVCKHLGKVFGLNFERVPGSGAFVGGLNADILERLTKEQILLSEGDIIVPDELSHIKIECKFHKDFSFHGLFEGNKTLDKWIEQAAEGTDRFWFLLFKINNKGQYVVFNKLNFKLFKVENYLQYNVNGTKCIIAKLDDFFEENKDYILELRNLYNAT